MIFKELKELGSNILSIDLSGNLVDDECIKSLGEFLIRNWTIKQLSMNDNKITDEGIRLLPEFLIGNGNLERLHLNSNRGISRKSTPFLIEIIKQCCITEIDLRWTSIIERTQQEISKLANVPITDRKIPFESKSKSAAKSSWY